ncbi:MAG TPA: alpha-glucan family phosphorylase, partial [Melioribacteraceae bacterium]|nr:alpha-glucan family phosphorylase [Melioribacteraceae bacterium]
VAGFKDIPFDEIPIDYVTNGIHIRTHLSNDMHELLYRYIGDKFLQNPTDPEDWERVDEIPDEELWRTHERRRERLVAFARARLRQQITSRGGSKGDVEAAKEVLNASALTIGFARRFATYKRGKLITRDLDRLADILCNKDFPVQIIIAGKAHPKDEEGKKLIQDLVAVAKEEHLRKKIVFLENYDMNIARYMVEGCDIWLNNPRRPLEASGTSGMKCIANGGLNFSVLDGWWDEGYNPDWGWKIGSGEEYDNLEYQDELESRLIYETLEKEIIPTFYNRTEDKLPRKWIAMMKASMKNLGPVFNTTRMVSEYAHKFYFKANEKWKYLMADDMKNAKEFTIWKHKVNENWNRLRIFDIKKETLNKEIEVGNKYSITAKVNLGDLLPKDVEVQIYYGKVDDQNKPYANAYVNMNCKGQNNGDNTYDYKGEIPCATTGNFGFTIRILPKHPILINPFELGLIKWV